MANTYSQLTVHVIFAVKHRENILTSKFRPELFKYISGIITNVGAKSLAVGGYTDHVHVLAGIPPVLSVADLVKTIKSNSSKWINENGLVVGKFQWQEGYGAFSCSNDHRNNSIRYIMAQEEHHKKKTFREEYLNLLNEMEVDFDKKYVFEFLD
jgi:REP element-mobilizing transposase RayT